RQNKILKRDWSSDVYSSDLTTAFKYVLKNKNILLLINIGMYLYQVSGVKYAIKKLNLLKPVAKFNEMNKAMTDVILSRKINRNINPFRRNDLSIGFFQGCIMDSFFSKINELAMKIMTE